MTSPVELTDDLIDQMFGEIHVATVDALSAARMMGLSATERCVLIEDARRLTVRSFLMQAGVLPQPDSDAAIRADLAAPETPSAGPGAVCHLKQCEIEAVCSGCGWDRTLHRDGPAEWPRVAAPVGEDYERGRLDVRRELTAALDRFNEDDSRGIGDVVSDVIDPFLLESPAPVGEVRDGRETPHDAELLLSDLEHWRLFLLRARVGHNAKGMSKGIHIDNLTCAAVCIGYAIKALAESPRPDAWSRLRAQIEALDRYDVPRRLLQCVVLADVLTALDAARASETPEPPEGAQP